MIFTLPNLLTLLRIVLLAPFFYLFLSDAYLSAALLLVFILLTDLFDGMLARKLDQRSYLGTILDPVADKLVVLLLFGFFYYVGLVPVWYFILILARDIAQLLSIPVLMLWMKIQFKVEPALIAKIGTALNFIILGVLYFVSWNMDAAFLEPIFTIFVGGPFLWGLFLVSAPIEIYILVTYIPRFFRIMRGTHDTFN